MFAIPFLDLPPLVGAAGRVQDGDAGVVVPGVGEAHAAKADGGELLAGLAVGLVDHGKISLGA